MCAFRLGFTRTVFLLAVFLGSALAMPNAAPVQQSAPNKQSDQPDPLKPLRLFIGKWQGDSQGQPGAGKMEREYALVLKNRFVQVSNKAVYPPQEKNPKGETHEDLGFFGYDRSLKKLSFRQFHIEGFVVQYALESISEDGRSFVFTSTAIENISPGWVARETYRFLRDDEFIETFALAGPGKKFETYQKPAFVGSVKAQTGGTVKSIPLSSSSLTSVAVPLPFLQRDEAEGRQVDHYLGEFSAPAELRRLDERIENWQGSTAIQAALEPIE